MTELQEPLTVYVVGMEALDQGPQASPWPDAAFTTEAAAREWGRARGQQAVGRNFWWGTVKDADDTYMIWELQVDRPDAE